MSDPAIEAAQRMWIRRYGGDGHFDRSVRNGDVGAFVVDAAREALKPIRELHYPREGSVSAMYPDPLCNCGDDWPCDTAKLIYTTEELSS
ncbi:hypothetical protein [Mycolicibacterium houstonense]|uniref:hypothetical protein n=1 Tax=Mycolicibacterium houstonense TaxID=146021 RepID=UPI00082FEA76|nr:hypothetical protein [Mycolicibacterium houstonense]